MGVENVRVHQLDDEGIEEDIVVEVFGVFKRWALKNIGYKLLSYVQRMGEGTYSSHPD